MKLKLKYFAYLWRYKVSSSDALAIYQWRLFVVWLFQSTHVCLSTKLLYLLVRKQVIFVAVVWKSCWPLGTCRIYVICFFQKVLWKMRASILLPFWESIISTCMRINNFYLPMKFLDLNLPFWGLCIPCFLNKNLQTLMYIA